ncbi:DEAD/DEAH box helicase [Nocardia brasiliensis]|uniref:DEAD/DEAH box helicase n=1 Tax=Nocardia brasiliensis TaxID=37326 RepID=UPI0018933FDB|nr:DEAD/DEAH box helicase [Nocardia brasiliensis]MBF6125456.1 DEAD/DEAH box helicase [Nocardia brasiliensis]
MLHGLWSPGSGLLLWHDSPLTALPEPLGGVLSASKFRHRADVLVAGPGGSTTEQVRAHAMAPQSAAEALRQRLPAEAVAGDLRFLAHVAHGIERWVRAGRIVPELRRDDGQWWVRWRLVGGERQRAWLAELAVAMPAALRVAGRPNAVLEDLVGELTDPIARALVDLPAPTHPLVDALVRDVALDHGSYQVAEVLERWRATLTGDEPELVLRLLEPDGELGTADDSVALWRLEVCLRLDGEAPSPVLLHSDPNLLRVAGEQLGEAQRAYPRLRDLPSDPRSMDLLLPTEVVIDLVEHGAHALQAAGVRLLLPRAWNVSAPTMRLRVESAVPAAESTVGMPGLVSYRWELALGDTVLTKAEMERLVRSKSDLVQLRGDWVQADHKVLAAAARYVAAHADTSEITFADLVGELAAGRVEQVPVTEVTATGWAADILDRTRDLAPIAPPVGLKAQLRPYQERGLSWLATMSRMGFGAILADDMGLGKTVQVLALLVHEREVGARPPVGPNQPADDRKAALKAGRKGRAEPTSTDEHGESTRSRVQVGAAHSAGTVAASNAQGAVVVSLDAARRRKAAKGSSGGGPQLLAGKTIDGAVRPHGTPDRAVGPTLLVCPMSVVGNWQRETERFAPDLRVWVHHGAGRHAGAELDAAVAGSDLVITTYSLLARDLDELKRQSWDRIVLDEAQHIKNAGTRQARAARALPARHRLALTGTPVENRLEELRSIMDFAMPKMLGSPQTFRARFAVPIERERDENAISRLRLITQPFVLRRVKTDPAVITDLPDKIEMTVRANLTVEQAALYQAVVDDMLAKIKDAKGMARKGAVLSALTRLKQVCNHPAHYLGDGSGILHRGSHRSGKLALVEDVLDAVLADGEKALLFTQFREFGELIAPYLTERFGTEIPFLHGGVPKQRRDSMVTRFQEPDGPSLMLLSLKAGGTGLNLTAANHVVHLDRWWNPAVENQATDRAFRIGQQRNVQVRKLVCVDTIEERIDEMINGKRQLADLAIGAGENWITELSTDDLRELFTLGAEAVGE